MDKKFKIFVIVAIIALFTVTVAGGFFIMNNISNKDLSIQVDGTYKHPKDMQVFELSNDITTNLISENDVNKKHVIKVTVGFTVDKKSRDFKVVAKEFAEKEILIRNEVIQALRDQSYENMAKSDAQKQLSEIILGRVSTLLFTQSIEDIYFGDFFVQ